MAADVSTEINEDKQKNKEFVTIDFFGCSNKDSEKKLWEEKLDYLSRSSSSSNELHDLNFPPPQSPASSYSSVCTLEKVKNALDRAKREPDENSGPNPKPDGQMKRQASAEDLTSGRGSSGGGSKMVVTVCTSCFQYLLISEKDPRCPNCNRPVSVAGGLFSRKKSRIDLNC